MNNIVLPGYQIIEQLHEGTKTVIYRATHEQQQTLAIVKALKTEYPTIDDITRLRHEYQILQLLNIEGVIKPLELKPYQHSFALILEYFSGQSLRQFLTARKISLSLFLEIGIALAKTLAELHQNQIIHKDIKPHNILIHPETLKIKLIDFSIATRLSRETAPLTHPNVLEGTLAYMSPEQTGRMNRSIDYRTDFYSLGVTFYEILTGQLPFITVDPLEFIHFHIAHNPLSPIQLNPEIPETVAAIVLKLLAKNAEDRYQSALGLQADLEQCLGQLKATGRIDTFVPGQLDRSSQFLIPQKLYGREREVAALMSAFARVSQGNAEFMLVSGYSGVGKTSAINEVHKPIVATRGYFISGKFDQFKKNIPYAALIQAFQELVRQLLTESTERVEFWKNQLLAAFGASGQAIVDVIPELELILGPQPEIPLLGAIESQNRFNRIFQEFIRTFCQPEHPLVLFLDDLQWADSASLKLIQLLLAEAELKYFLLIGAYRDNEVSPTHPTILTIDEIEKLGAIVSKINLRSLDFHNVALLIGDTLNEDLDLLAPLSDKNRVLGLAELLFNKSQGNPFFLIQLLKSLYTEGLLTFNFPQSLWQWDLQQIQGKGITDYTVVELVAQSIQKLPEATQSILKLAACIGNSFSLDVLGRVTEKTASEAASNLWLALQAGLILPLTNNYKTPLVFGQGIPPGFAWKEVRVTYKFLHDRVQQAAYSLIPELEKKETHLKIGRLLLQHTEPQTLEDNIFDIVNQLNVGVESIEEPAQRDELCRLNLLAGQKAKAAAAYEATLRYLNVSLELLPENSWQNCYELARDVYLNLLEAEYLNIHFERTQDLSNRILLQARTIEDKIQVYELKIPFYFSQNQLDSALETALQVLEILEIDLPRGPSKLQIVWELIHTRFSIGNRHVEDLANLPPMTDRQKLAAMRILTAVVSVATNIQPTLFPILVFRMIVFSITYGNSPLSAYAYATYGLLLCGVLNDIESGYEFGKLALKLLDKLGGPEIKAKVYFIYNQFIRLWKEPLQETLQPFLEAFKIGMETGDLEYGCYGLMFYANNSFWSGEHLESVAKVLKESAESCHQYKQEVTGLFAKIWQQTVSILRGEASQIVGQLKGSIFDEDVTLPLLKETNNKTGLALVYLAKSFLLYVFKDFSQSVTLARAVVEYKETLSGSIYVVEHNFYFSLALLANIPTASKSEHKQYLKQVAIQQKQMQKWATHAPMNFQHKYDLIEAERSRILNRHSQAMALYERAIAGAKKNGYLQEEAIANERAAEFYLGLGREAIAKTYMTAAYYSYIRWGAIAKAKDLDSRYANLIARNLSLDTQDLLDIVRTTSTSTSGKNARILDLNTVIKASITLSGEMILSNLLDKLMKITLENAGASKGYFISKQSNQWMIQASGEVDRDNEIAIQLGAIAPQDRLPITLINYVERTRKNYILDDATLDPTFASDPYILTNQPKSVLCVPLIHQDKLTGILYLENSQTVATFTTRHLEVLSLLTAQISISLENALLYANLEKSNQQLTVANTKLERYSHTLEQKVAERTQELQEKNTQLEQTLNQLKTAQKQIIAQEKLASLGALTAGVAHEIRNPLNFVTSLATLSEELVVELTDVFQQPTQTWDSGSLETIQENLSYLKRNVAEINQQGQRVNSIIQSMLMHARAESSSRQKTDINALVAQAVQLAYHSIRAKDKTFSVTLETDYDETVGSLEVSFSDLSRAFINIIDNACYSVRAKRLQLGVDFQPVITIITRNSPDKIEVRVRDNGFGIPPEIRDKLFLPFFTTKPPGQGTGLGLSIAHEIIVGQHRGDLEVQTELGIYTEFIMTLPRN